MEVSVIKEHLHNYLRTNRPCNAVEINRIRNRPMGSQHVWSYDFFYLLPHHFIFLIVPSFHMTLTILYPYIQHFFISAVPFFSPNSFSLYLPLLLTPVHNLLYRDTSKSLPENLSSSALLTCGEATSTAILLQRKVSCIC